MDVDANKLTPVEMSEREENINLLKRVVKEGEFVAAFVGSGPSTSVGIKSWDDLLSDMAREFHVDMDVKKIIDQKGYAEAASEIYRHIEDHDSYLDFMQRQFRPTNDPFSPKYSLIVRNFPLILTTNFDICIEKACEFEKISFHVQKLPDFNEFELFQQDAITIVYLHGNTKDNKYIFLKEDYDQYYPSISNLNGSKDLEHFLRSILKRITLVFIGFSFNDRYFYKFFRKIVKEEILQDRITHQKRFRTHHPRPDVNHFILISKSEDFDELKKDELKKIGLKCIWYEQHIDIWNILERVFDLEPKLIV